MARQEAEAVGGRGCCRNARSSTSTGSNHHLCRAAVQGAARLLVHAGSLGPLPLGQLHRGPGSADAGIKDCRRAGAVGGGPAGGPTPGQRAVGGPSHHPTCCAPLCSVEPLGLIPADCTQPCTPSRRVAPIPHRPRHKGRPRKARRHRQPLPTLARWHLAGGLASGGAGRACQGLAWRAWKAAMQPCRDAQLQMVSCLR